MLFDSSLELGDIGLIAVTAVLTYGVWQGKSWAFVWLFASYVLCVISLVIYGIVTREVAPLIAPAVLLIGLLVLLLHPSTRRFALAEAPSVPETPSVDGETVAPEPVGMRRNTVIALGMLLVAITIAGVLGVMRAWQLAG